MITGIAIENFKGIGERVELELRPITLLFGANSAGKSSILHALHYAREVFERHNLDADQTIAGGNHIDLGGFEHFIYRKQQGHLPDKERRVCIRIKLKLGREDLPSFDADFDSMSQSLQMPFNSLLNEIESTAVELAIAWSDLENRPFVASNTIYFNDVQFAQITAPPNLGGAVLKFVRCVEDLNNPGTQIEGSSLDHPCLKKVKATNSEEMRQYDLFEDESLLHMALSLCGDILSSDGQRLELSGRGDALPDIDSALQFDLEPYVPTGDEEDDHRLASETNLASELALALSDLIIGPCQLIRDHLKQFRYLGPLRDTPPRNYQPPRYPDPSRWSSGLGAWDTLQNGHDKLLDAVGMWLGDPDNLNAGCRVERRNILELDRANPVVTKLINRRALDDLEEDEGVDLTKVPSNSRIVIVPVDTDIELRPHDVGIGISQVVPVIVTALDGEERLLAIEQPELHIHPRLQAEIADLFVEAIQKSNHRFIIETHSEHLILRLLRRIRETEKGTAEADRQLRTYDLAVYYLRHEHDGSKESRIDVDVKGEFIQPWPDDFFEIDFNERFR